MRVAGITLSALGHGLVIWLALTVAPPWLRPHRTEPVPAVSVQLVSAAELAGREAAARARAAAGSAPSPAAPQPPRTIPVPPPSPPEQEAELVPEPSLAPAFDAEAPLGLGASGGLEPVPPRPRQPPLTPEQPPEVGAVAAPGADHGAAVRAAILRARVYPPVARDRGLVGEVRLLVMVDRSGRLINARLLRLSGSRTLDDAALAAARNARLPAAPADLAGQRFSYEVELTFTFRD